ncbi:MAG TPA: glycosyltransferase family 2 protein [Candidatus Dormibacteraeota bacterium]|nr:glycosyltransferase family 2 protein [Candidatus Dormibacteraeota bacterium]
MKLSVVIPVLNERDSLPATIAALRACRGIEEIIVSDGGSTDGTGDWVRAQPDLLLVDSARGKGPQLNAGAARATGDVLLFLHADCALSQAAFDALQSPLFYADRSDPQISTPHVSTPHVSTPTLSASGLAAPNLSVSMPVGGAFYLRFAEARPRSLRLVAWGINLRARLRGSATGDQGIFVRRDVFHSIGGAPDWPLFEDVELVRRIKRAGKFVVLKAPLTVSGRRYIQHGVLRTALLIYSLRLAYWLGVPPHRLKNWFRDARR